jgi:hypothetical protein
MPVLFFVLEQRKEPNLPACRRPKALAAGDRQAGKIQGKK